MQNSGWQPSHNFNSERPFYASESFQYVDSDQIAVTPPRPQYEHAIPSQIGVALTSSASVHHSQQHVSRTSLTPTPNAEEDAVGDELRHKRPTKKLRTSWAWLVAVLTLVSLAVTALYATQRIGKLKFVTASSSTTILVLRVLSELTGVLLATSIALAFEKVQWLLTVRARGVPLKEYVALQAGTSVCGSLLLAARRSVPKANTRTWSVLRLLGVGIIPAMGILIMSESPEGGAVTCQSNYWFSDFSC